MFPWIMVGTTALFLLDTGPLLLLLLFLAKAGALHVMESVFFPLAHEVIFILSINILNMNNNNNTKCDLGPLYSVIRQLL